MNKRSPHTDAESRVDRFIKNPNRALFVIGAPMTLGFMIHALYSVVDAIFIGKLGAEALAAVGYITSLFFGAIAFTNGLATGITATIAKAFGAQDHHRLHLLASNGLLLGTIIGIAFAVVGLIAGPWVIPSLGAQGASVELAWDYMVPMWTFMPLFFISSALRSIISGEGDAKTPMVIMATSTIMNAVLDPIYIFVFKMGIAGAAWATVTSTTFSFFAFSYVMLIKKTTLSRIKFSSMKPSIDCWGPIIRVGLPATAGHIVMAAGMILFTRVVSEFGQTAVAGYVAGNKMDMLVALPLLGISSAAMTLTGIFTGAQRHDLVQQTTINAYKWSIASAVFLGILAFIFAQQIVSLFVDDIHASSVGSGYLRYTIWAYPFMAIGMCTGRILQGLGLGWPTLVITSVRVLLIGAVGAYAAIYAFHAPIESIWISFVSGSAGAAVLSIIWMRKKLWTTHLQIGVEVR